MNIKKTAVVTCFAVLAVASAASGQVTGGIKAGLNVANQTVSQLGVTTSAGNREAAIAGGFLDIPLARHVALQPEALVDMKGAESSFSISGVSRSSVLRLTSLDIPVLLRIDVVTSGRVIPYAYAGPTIAFLLSATTHSVVNGTVHDEDVSDLKTTELGATVGGGVRFRSVIAELRFTRGLTNAFAGQLSSSVTITNRTIAVIGGVRF